MAENASAANPSILRWARERAGHTLEEVADAFGKDVSVIESWETPGGPSPTMGQLDRLAYQLYRRPLAIFFFPEPPDEEIPEKQFRTLPQFEIDKLAPDTLYALREGRAMQISLRELADGVNPAESRIFEKFQPTSTHGIPALTRRVREFLGLSLEDQIGWSNKNQAFKNWRSAIEQKGVFVFKRAFRQRETLAFSLLDTEFPIIYINNGTSVRRQIFSLFHELGHILFQTSGVTNADTSFIDDLTAGDRTTETACNRFAAELLGPTDDFRRHASGYTGEKDEVKALAARYWVSREVIIFRLLNCGLIDDAEYTAKAAELNAQFHARPYIGRPSGGNYYATKYSPNNNFSFCLVV